MRYKDKTIKPSLSVSLKAAFVLKWHAFINNLTLHVGDRSRALDFPIMSCYSFIGDGMPTISLCKLGNASLAEVETCCFQYTKLTFHWETNCCCCFNSFVSGPKLRSSRIPVRLPHPFPFIETVLFYSGIS